MKPAVRTVKKQLFDQSSLVRSLKLMRPRAPILPVESKVSNHNDANEQTQIDLPSPLGSTVRALQLSASVIAKILYLTVKTAVLYFFRHPFHAMFNALVLGILWIGIVTGSDIHEQLILGQMSDQTVNSIVKASRFSRDFLTSEVSSHGIREYLRAGGPEWAQRESVKAILFHARKAGLSVEHQAVLLATAEIESGFNPMAKASTTSACGLYQFVKATGEMYGLKQNDCMNPWLNAKAGVAHYIDNYEKRIADKVTATQGPEQVFEIYEAAYYMHHDGPNYSDPSNDVKATILGGTQFLLNVHNLLKLEDSSRAKAPTFAERFNANLWDTLHALREFLGRIVGTENLAYANGALTIPDDTEVRVGVH